MPFNEVTQAIAWNQQSNSVDSFRVSASLTMHAGRTDNSPLQYTATDQVWYATGDVWAVVTPGVKPHLAGTLTQVSTTGSTGSIEPKPRVSVGVEIYPDGTFTYQRLIDTNPAGGMPPTKLQMTDVKDVLLTGIDGNQVITVGVARQPKWAIPPK